MPANRTGIKRHAGLGRPFLQRGDHPAPRAGFGQRWDVSKSIGFALTLLVLGCILPAVGVPWTPDSACAGTPAGRLATATAQERFSQQLDHDGNGIEDLLDRWRDGTASWADLQQAARPQRAHPAGAAKAEFPLGVAPTSAGIGQDRLRVLCLGLRADQIATARRAAATAGICRVVHDVARFGGVTVLDLDAAGLRNFLTQPLLGAVMLDRDGVPALVASRALVGTGRVAAGDLELGNDWSTTVAILDSGLDTAHGDLGDAPDDDNDGPPPAVGDLDDWFPADAGWPLFSGYKVVGWHDVSDDFPASQGPWDYHYHGTALAWVVAGSGAVDPDYRGLAPGGRLTIVKYYDFDQTWHAWAGDFLAACEWTLEQRDIYRIGTVLMAVNWDVDAGISTAMDAFVAAGIMPVAAMGNFGTDPGGPGYPASLPSVLTAGAVNAAGAVSVFSGRGLAGDLKPDLVAPGGGLLQSGGRIVAADIDPNDSYSGRYGTSLAAAHLAGASYLLDEALRENGVVMPSNAAAVKARQTVLKLATAPVILAESPDGTGAVGLPEYVGHDPVRGFGHLRVDAAVRAMIDPLLPGQTQTDTLSSNWSKPVLARRLGTNPGIRYLVEAIPAGSLDVSLEVVSVGGPEIGADGEEIIRTNLNGPGVSEFTYFEAGAESWSFLAVKRLSGAGNVTLRLLEADVFAEQGAAVTLPGVGSGAPNLGNLAPFPGPSLIVPSRVLVDPVARSMNVLDLGGNFRPGWPVFVFPVSSSQGGLTQPMVQNLDGVAGDEFVVASDFGSVYFFKGDGAYKTVNLELNRWLTAPVGFQNAVGGWRVLVVDRLGWARSWSWNAAVNAEPELEQEVLLAHELPLAPAAGRLTVGGGESLVVAFTEGWVAVLDETLAVRSGWPKDLGVPLEVAPVLCDLDADGLHEIVLPVRDETSGQLLMRVFDGAGNPLPSDGTLVPAPGGGRWLQLSEAVVSGTYGSGLNVAVAGLADNGLSGGAAGWSLALGKLLAAGGSQALPMPGFAVGATTDEGELQVEVLLLPAPLAWNQSGDFGTEPATLFHVTWNEVLYGFTSIPGATTGWLLSGESTAAMVQKQPLLLGGSQQASLAHLSGLLVPLANGTHLRVEVLDRQLGLAPVLGGPGGAALWRAQRGDARNSGSLPLREPATAAPQAPPGVSGLRAYPNPGSGRFHFRAESGRLQATARLEIFDLRGRRVKQPTGADAAGEFFWDGTDHNGRRLAAGTYLAVVRINGQKLTTRIVLTR